jgi:hypothetical protein
MGKSVGDQRPIADFTEMRPVQQVSSFENGVKVEYDRM